MIASSYARMKLKISSSILVSSNYRKFQSINSRAFICGLKSAKDADVKLKYDTTDTNIKGLVTERQRLSNFKHDTVLVDKKFLSSEV